ncbi:MAG: MFS transporter [Alphaproteobacteria bacterium]|nr:MFS transporter [Alphaproteobacteria bacterium]
MAYLTNSAVNRVNVHYAIQAFASAAAGTFLLVYFVRAGLSPPGALLALAATVFGRFVSRPLVLPVAKRFGLKAALIVGTLLLACQYPAAAYIDGVSIGLVLRCLFSALGDAFYWTSYHAYFASLGDSEHRGHQISAREAIVALIGIVAPIAGTWGMVTLGVGVTFAAAGLVQALAVLPLLALPAPRVRAEAPGAFAQALPAAQIFAAHGWFTGAFILVWWIALFVALDKSYASFGGAMTLAALAGAAGGLLLGKGIDAGHGARAVVFVFALMVLAIVLRGTSLGTPWLAVVANVFGVFAMCFYVPTLMTAVYNLAKASPCPLRFHMATEGGWDIGCFAVLLLSAGLLYGGVSAGVTVLLALPAVIAIGGMLRRHYAAA